MISQISLSDILTVFFIWKTTNNLHEKEQTKKFLLFYDNLLFINSLKIKSLLEFMKIIILKIINISIDKLK